MNDTVDKLILVKLSSTAVLAASLSATTLVWFYENYRIPLKVVETTIEFKEISRKNDELKIAFEKEKTKNDETQDKLNKTKLELSELNKRIQIQNTTIKMLSQANLFHSDSFYPAGYGTPKIGDSIDILKTLYKTENIEWKKPLEDEWKVKVSIVDSYFQKIEYDYDIATKKVKAVLFSTETGSDKILLKRLSEIGGPPIRSRKYDVYRWHVARGVNSFLVSGNTYMILSEGMVPALWREPIDP